VRVILKRLLLSIAGGSLFQVLACLLAMILQSPALALVFLLPGWALGFAGRDSDHSWSGEIIGWIVMLGVNNLFYSSAIYFLLWRREVQKEIRENDLDLFVKKPKDEAIHKVKV
jgi:uncharacterized membrane protein